MTAGEITAGEVHLWYAFSGRAERTELLESYRSILSADELRRHDRFVFDRDRRRFLISHALVRGVLSSYAAVEPEAWRFVSNEHGKPEIESPRGGPQLRFNLSHTDGLSACAVTLERDVGVDVEMTRRTVSDLEIARRSFAPSEQEELERLPEERRRERFFDYWTLKEAYVKARGTGMSLPLDEFAFRLPPGEPPAVRFVGGIDDDPRRWRFFQDRPGPHHRTAVAVRCAAGDEIELWIRETVPLESPAR
jgi:4'-phosphopantetheinyl transferase